MTLEATDRIWELSSKAIERLDKTPVLSNCLDASRVVFVAASKPVLVCWIDREIYGLVNAPFARGQAKSKEESEGVLLFMELRRATKPTGKARLGPPKDDESVIVYQSIGELERLLAANEQLLSTLELRALNGMSTDLETLNTVRHVQDERHRVIQAVRSFLHQKLSDVLLEAESARFAIKLVGPDYRFVIDNLQALDTDVGNELKSALGLIGSDNSADWSAAALVCRNVVLKLGPLLFALEVDSHHSAMTGKSLDLKGEREKNRLLAYIDFHWVKAPNEVSKQSLSRCAELAIRLYEHGSMGKRSLRFAEAQQLVVDAFEFVALLASATVLTPLTAAEYVDPAQGSDVVT